MKSIKLLFLCLLLIISCREKKERNMEKIKVVIQHFYGCPNGPKMIDSVKMAISEFEDRIEYSGQIIDTPELARKYNFRGSPTLLINGLDIEDMTAPENPNLSCRFYHEGLPTVEKIRRRIKSLIGN